MSRRDGIVDRRFYAVCAADRLDDLCGLLARAGFSVHPLRGRQLRMLLLASALGGSPDGDGRSKAPWRSRWGGATSASVPAWSARCTSGAGPVLWFPAFCRG